MTHPSPQLSQLLARVRQELSASFIADRPIRASRAPAALDVMGGAGVCAGSVVCLAAMDRGAAAAVQDRDDREVQVFSFNQFDHHAPFTLRISLDAIAALTADDLRRGFDQPGRNWAAPLVGGLFVLHDRKLIDLRDPKQRGMHVAVQSDLPGGASRRVEAAMMLALRDHFGLAGGRDAMRQAQLCQAVDTEIVGGAAGLIEFLAGECPADHLLRVLSQPCQVQAPLALPSGVRVVAILGGGHSPDAGPPRHTRCAAFMGHRILLEKMRQIGRAARRTLTADPMGGYLANLSAEDYQKFFRAHLPETMRGGEFLLRYGGTMDAQTKVEPGRTYPIRSVVDYHVFDAARVKEFIEYLEEAVTAEGLHQEVLLHAAGGLMFESHAAATSDAIMAASERDLLIDLIRQRSTAGLFGARAAADGGAIAVLVASGPHADAAIAEVLAIYLERTGKAAEVIPCGGVSESTSSTGLPNPC